MPRQTSKPLLVLFVSLLFFSQLVGFIITGSGAGYLINNGLPIFSATAVSVYYYIVLTLALVGVLYMIRKVAKGNVDFSLALICSGAISNLIDRVARGGVIDYINLRVWPSFNVSDIFIVIGAILLLTRFLISSPRR